MDLFEPESSPGVRANGIVRKCPYQQGSYVYQPAYSGATPFFIDMRDAKVWTRAHYPASGAWGEEDLLMALHKFTIPEEARWLHCLKIGTNKRNGTSYATAIVDFVHESMTHSERRNALSVCFKQLGVRTAPETDGIYLVPEFPLEVGDDLWAGLHVLNTDWKRADLLPEPFYSGMIAKQADAKYVIQLNDHNVRTPKWMLHHFAEAYCEK